MAELKPCPFCGSKEIKIGAFSVIPDVHIYCVCGAYMGDFNAPSTAGQSDKEREKASVKIAIEAWNRRAKEADGEGI
jgi:Lar family restriction alleviation protein